MDSTPADGAQNGQRRPTGGQSWALTTAGRAAGVVAGVAVGVLVVGVYLILLGLVWRGIAAVWT